MKIKDIFEEILEEEVQNKKLFNALMEKWFLENPQLTDTMGEALYTRFQEIKNGLNPKIPQVRSFLSRFDGQFGYNTFNPEFLKDITKYSYHQIKSLIDEYTPLDQLEHIEDVTIFNPKDTRPNPQKLQASKDMWFGDRDCILNLDGFRVYDIKDQQTAVKFGYYVEQMNSKYIGANSPWCVTWRKDQKRDNMWGTYRGVGYERTFYFVIDESLSPEINDNRDKNRYYLGALQYSPNTASKFILTSVKNDGDMSKTWNDIVTEYPKLKDYKDLIKNRPYSTDELKEISVVGQITEAPGPLEFRRQEKGVKKSYINNGGILTDPNSWASMDGELRNLYINGTNRESAVSRFGNYNFLSEIRKTGNDMTLLNNRLKTIGLEGGVGSIYDYLIKNDYKIGRPSKDNSNVRLYVSKTDGKFGIFNTTRGDWYNKDGVTYEPIYRKIKTEAIVDTNNKPYVVETYSNDGSINDRTFYSVFPPEGNNASAHFISNDSYIKLLEKMSQEQIKGKEISRIKDFEPGQDVDIKEIKGGV